MPPSRLPRGTIRRPDKPSRPTLPVVSGRNRPVPAGGSILSCPDLDRTSPATGASYTGNAPPGSVGTSLPLRIQMNPNYAFSGNNRPFSIPGPACFRRKPTVQAV